MTHEALEAAVEIADNNAAARQRVEAQAVRRIEDAEATIEALALLESAVPQLSRRSLPTFVERIARVHARALARLVREERRAVGAIVRRGER